MRHSSSSQSGPALISLLLALGVLLLLALILSARREVPTLPEPPRQLGELIRTGQVPPPVLTDEMRTVLETHPVLDAIVSYTDSGFEPVRLTVPAGATIRFVNNSSNVLWVAGDSDTAPPYPPRASSCGPSAIDSCGPVQPQGVWTVRVEAEGTWGIRNSLRTEHGLIIDVR